MLTEYKVAEEQRSPRAMNPQKFAMWLFIASITMLFAALTSAYIVRRGEGNWVYFGLPGYLYATTGIILLSSLTLQLANSAAKRLKENLVFLWVLVTFLLGLLFLVGQFSAWRNLVERGIYLVGNPSGSFLYMLTGLHGLHIISGLIFLVIVLFKSRNFTSNSKQFDALEMCTTYWHFLGGLWVYLFLFLLFSGQ